MTPKEKANELVDKMHNKYLISYIEAQRCALIAVDEIKKHTYMGKSKYKNDNNSFEYWTEVKQEIEKL